MYSAPVSRTLVAFATMCVSSPGLEGNTALWDRLTYVETSPVRAGLAESPGDYRFCAWGRMVGGGTHPFAENLVRHLRQ